LIATSQAIANTIPKRKLNCDNIIPDMYDKNMSKNISRALSKLYTEKLK
jgi:hypothetical protein